MSVFLFCIFSRHPDASVRERWTWRFQNHVCCMCLIKVPDNTSGVSPSGYKPFDWQSSKLLCGTFMNPAPIPSCGICVPLGESSAPSLRHPCAVKRSKRRCSLGRINRRRVGSEAPRLPSVLAAHRHRKQTEASSIDNAEPAQSTNGRQRVYKKLHMDLLSVLYRITVICRCFGVPVPGGVAAVTGGTDSEGRQLTNRTITTITRPLSESRSIGLAVDFKAPPQRAANVFLDVVCNADGQPRQNSSLCCRCLIVSRRCCHAVIIITAVLLCRSQLRLSDCQSVRRGNPR